MTINFWQSLTGRLFKMVFSWYLVLAISVTAVQLVLEYQSINRMIASELTSQAQSFKDSITEALWALNMPLLQSMVQGIAQSSFVTGVMLDAKDDEIDIVTGHIPSSEVPAALGIFPRYQSSTVLLEFGAAKGVEQLGRLVIYSDRSVALNRIKASFIAIVINSLIKTAGLWVIFYLVISRSLSIPLAALEHFVTRIEFASDSMEKIALDYPHDDELGRLMSAMNKMQHRLFDAHYELDLANKDLERKIELRTKELSAALEFVRTVLNNSPLPMGVYDVNGQCVLANDAYAQMVGATKDQLLSQNFYKIGSWRQSGLLDICIKALADYLPQQCEIKTVSSFGKEVWVSIKIFPTYVNGKKHLLLQFVDLTERKQFELTLLQAKDAAETANHAKSSFVANMSHEIRTPMNAVLGFLRLLNLTPINKQQRDYLAKATTAAESLLCILNDILDFSKVEAGKLSLDLQPFSLRMLIDRLMSILASAVAQKQIQLRFEISDNLPAQVVGDSLRLQQVLLNLTSNAVKFTDQGEVVLGVQVIDSSSDIARLEFWVRDTGIGIAADKLATIFQEFSQAESSTTRRFGGTGLGLTISQRLIEMMGGILEVASTLGVGSRFFFVLELPCSDIGITEINETVDVSGNNQPLAQLRLMLVEDNPLNQQVARELLEHLGATIQVANNGQEAVQMWTRAPAAFDEMLMDVQMPVMDGHEAARLLRAQGCTIPIIAMTASALLADQQACLAAGMNDHVGKPFDIHQLVATLLRHSGRREQPVILESTPATTPPQAPLLDAPGFDFNAALARLGNRMPTYLTLVRQFMYDQQAIMERLRHDQNVNAAREIHTMKGIAGAVGAIELAQWLADAEQQVKMQGINSAMLNILESKMAATIQILEQLLARLEIHTTPSVSVDLMKYLERLAPLLQANNLEALDVWEELLQAHGQKLAPQLISLDAAMKQMDFAAACDLCREIKQG